MQHYPGTLTLSGADDPNQIGTYTLTPYTNTSAFPFNAHTVIVKWDAHWHTNAPAADAKFHLEKPTKDNHWLGTIDLTHTQTGHDNYVCHDGILFDFSIDAVVENAHQIISESPIGCDAKSQAMIQNIGRHSPFLHHQRLALYRQCPASEL